MADHEIKAPREFTFNVRKVETTDLLHPDSVNPQFSGLINNDAFLKECADGAQIHIEDSNLHVTAAQKTTWDGKAERTAVTAGTNGLMAAADKAKLDGIVAGAQPNQNAIAGIKAGNTTVLANTAGTTMELAAGSNITLTADNATKKVTIGNSYSYVHPSTHPASIITGLEGATVGNANKLGNIAAREYATQDWANTQLTNVLRYKETSEAPLPPLPLDADRLGGYSPDHYATAAGLEQANAELADRYTKAESDAVFDRLDALFPAEMHRTIYRGKNLGTALLPAQKSCIQDGTFKGLWLGDYWVIGGRNWRIVDIDYWYNCGDAAFTKHHLVIMPDVSLYAAQMNETNITTGGYVGSKMYTTNLANAKTLVNSAFGSAVLVHRDLLVNAVSDGYSVGGAWYDSSVELPNEIMMYGSYVHTPAGNGTIVLYRCTIDKTQLALFQACPKFITNRDWYWLRDVASAAFFAYVADHGQPNCTGASTSLGVRPVFAIG